MQTPSFRTFPIGGVHFATEPVHLHNFLAVLTPLTFSTFSPPAISFHKAFCVYWHFPSFVPPSLFLGSNGMTFMATFPRISNIPPDMLFHHIAWWGQALVFKLRGMVGSARRHHNQSPNYFCPQEAVPARPLFRLFCMRLHIYVEHIFTSPAIFFLCFFPVVLWIRPPRSLILRIYLL